MNTRNLKKTLAGAAITGVLGLPALGLGIGAGTASADPNNHGCFNPYSCSDNNDNGRGNHDQDYDHNLRWDQRGIDQGRYDHQPFDYQGQRVEPYFDNDRGVFGFQFFGIFIPL